MRPKNGKLARAHSWPNIHKHYSNIPKFRPIVDNSGTPHFFVGKFVTNLLNAPSLNELTLKESFDAVNAIRILQSHLFNDEYNYVSVDVEFLFTYLPIKRTIYIILKRIYIDKVISTNLKMRSMSERFGRILFNQLQRFSNELLPALRWMMLYWLCQPWFDNCKARGISSCRKKKLIQNYLSQSQQTVKVGSSLSE